MKKKRQDSTDGGEYLVPYRDGREKALEERPICSWCRHKKYIAGAYQPSCLLLKEERVSPLNGPYTTYGNSLDKNSEGRCEDFTPSKTTKLLRLLGKRKPVQPL